MIRITNIKIGLNKLVDLDTEKQALQSAIIRKLKINKKELLDFKIFKKSIDARKKDKINFIYTVDVNVHHEDSIQRKCRSTSITQAPDLPYEEIKYGTENMVERPVVIGMGPAGLFAGLVLSKNGYKPIILERGEDVDTRTSTINKFWNEHQLDTDSNVQFGEGGAGTFSDGKLTTQIKDKRCREILEYFVKAGAPENILYDSKPHIGTDVLKKVVKRIREEIIKYGGEVRFKAKVTDFILKDSSVEAVIINEQEKLPCKVVLLAIGHSARDTFEMLHRNGVAMIQKPFSIGVRIEHPQAIIDEAQYGESAGHPALGAANYKLSYHSNKNGRSAYTFCMCPGGYVVAAASEEKGIVTNGMSEHKRDGKNANSALLVGVKPVDFQSDHPLAGVEFQRKWERLAFKIGGQNYQAPAQLTGDFLNDRPSNHWGSVHPTYKPGVTFASLKDCLPNFVTETLKEAIVHFDTKIKGFAMPESILTGVETRSSSPVRMTRDENYLSNLQGIYPVGEGAGYAGGIMSSAVDGFKVAEKVMEKYIPLDK